MTTERSSGPETTPYAIGAVAAVLAFVGAGALLAVTLPYHQWDSFGFANWSRAIAEHGRLDPLVSGPLQSSRPLFYELQGAVWWITGVSFTAGRLLSLAFAVLLLGSVLWLARILTSFWLEAAIAVAVMIAVPMLAQETLAGQTDVPAAAMVALVAALALRAAALERFSPLLVAAAALAVLTKQSVLVALVPLNVVLLAGRPQHILGRLRGAAGALGAGLAVGLSYDLVMASRFHEDLPVYLRQGTTGIWAELAARARGDVLLRADVLGSGLRLPLTFALVYAAARLLRLRHRFAVPLALAAGLVWCIAGPLAAGVSNGAFSRPEDGFTLVGFALLLAAGSLLPDEEAPARRTLLVGLALAVPPLVVWVDYTAYTDRLASAAWPGLAVLIASVVAAGIRGLRQWGTVFALAPIALLAMAVWMSLATFDGLHGPMWTEYRSLGVNGLRDQQRTMHVVLPALQSTLATAQSALGDGRLVTGDPMIPWFMPGRVDSSTPGKCRDVKGERVFVLLTGDESLQSAREEGRLATPEQWVSCSAPKLRLLSDGSNGYAVLAVEP